ncbi:MAG: hypothetical protein LBJ57_02720 [Prevotellaceae bacterium]|jgi:hypothetical protein|nr:hypothetical protein [Prevotellaceae bacterium]
MNANYQYPQYLYALRTEEATQNPQTGSWEDSPAAWELMGICREETNGKGHSVTTSGGEAVIFSSLIQIPKGTPRINEGTQVAITREQVAPENLLSDDFRRQGKISGAIVAAGKCMKYDFGRLHCRLWI